VIKILIFCLFLICPLLHADQSNHAAALAARLSDSDLAAQVLLTGIDGRQSLTTAMKSILERLPAGGIMLFRYNLDSSKAQVKSLLSSCASLVVDKNGIPPFMAVDHEGGLVHRFAAVAERLPSAFSFWELAQREGREAALENAKTLYTRSAKEIMELGINMVLGPVAEILNEDNRVFLETRSYGPDPDFVQAAASVYIKSMDSAGIASAVKHFPGNTNADPHTGASVLKNGRVELNEMVIPFAGIIRELDPSALMLSHVMVPAIDSNRNASLSRTVIENWLRRDLGFKGIIIADDFSMGAVSGSGLDHAAATVEALNAGVDMIMVWPHNIVSVHSSILKALSEGRLSRERLLEAAERIIKEKIRYGLIN